MPDKVRNTLLSEIIFYYHLLLGKLFGISYVVNYLRNPNPSISVRLLRVFGAKIGEDTTIKRSLYLDNVYEDEDSIGNFSYLTIGNNCYIGDCVFIDLANEVIIGNNVVISGKVSFVTHADCNRSVYLINLFPRTCDKIIVQDGAWIGFDVIILKGLKIGENSVIGARSLVRDDVEEYSLYIGMPAIKTKKLI
jgi:acetyltransferase-like isoleucine patch superfamily enzyme